MEKISVNEACKYLSCTKSNVYNLVRNKKVIFSYRQGKCGNEIIIDFQSLEKYKEKRYSRDFSKGIDGNFLYDKKKGILNVSECAKELQIPPQRIYYLLRKKIIPFKKNNYSYILSLKDVKNSIDNHNHSRTSSIMESAS